MRRCCDANEVATYRRRLVLTKWFWSFAIALVSRCLELMNAPLVWLVLQFFPHWHCHRLLWSHHGTAVALHHSSRIRSISNAINLSTWMEMEKKEKKRQKFSKTRNSTKCIRVLNVLSLLVVVHHLVGFFV